MRGSMRRLVLLLALACLAPASAAQAATLGGWDRAEQRAVARAGVLPKLPGGFHGEKALTAGQLDHALAAIARRTGARPVAVPAAAPRIPVAGFPRYVVRHLGLADLARSVQVEAAGAGLRPPSRFGTEVVARQLGLRFAHPSRDD